MRSIDVLITYKNWRGETRDRLIQPIQISFTSTEWHKEVQWLLSAIDKEDGKIKEFAMSGITKWVPQ